MNASRNRKIAYLLAVVGLFTGLLVLSGSLDRRAEEYKLAQKSLGNVNPVSGTAQVVLMGFRGVAVTFLWQEAIDLKKKERWFEIRPVLESITLLQPNFLEPWTHQAWNMAYNIAAEWESVPDKYYWISQGVDFMKNACKANRDKPDLEWYTGWIYHNRMGTSDENVYLREMFRNDPDDEYAMSTAGIKDSYLVAYDWFNQASGTVQRINKRPRRMGITPFMSYPAKSKTDYAERLGKDGTFGPITKRAWESAYRTWTDFGRIGGDKRETSLMLRLEYSDNEWKELTEEQKYWIDRYRNTIKYNHWKLRTKIEGTDEMLAARQAFFEADAARKEGDYRTAIAKYEAAFPGWRKILEANENLRVDDMFSEQSQESESAYLRLLERLGLTLPAKRPFEGMYPALITYRQPSTGRRDLQRPETPKKNAPATKGAAPSPETTPKSADPSKNAAPQAPASSKETSPKAAAPKASAPAKPADAPKQAAPKQ
jgi:hypothetical protein